MSDLNQADLRERFKAWVKECDRTRQRWRDMVDALAGSSFRAPPAPSFTMPEELRTLSCGATTRRKGVCKRTDIFSNGRCKHHGGLSTGPKTAEGRGKAQANLKLRWRPGSEPHGALVNAKAATSENFRSDQVAPVEEC